MSRTVYAHQHDTLDAICYRVLGQTAGVTEQALELNPGIAEFGPVLPQGTAVRLPNVTTQPSRAPSVQLWD